MQFPSRRILKSSANRCRTLSDMARSGNLIIVSGPSGAGKSALVGGVLKLVPRLRFSVSYTTRSPRGTEKHGVEYFFVDRNEFQSFIGNGEMLEWAEVHGNYYGTSKRFVDDFLQSGDDVILDIDVQGARTIRQKRPDAVAAFILPPSYQVLRDRLEQRRLDEGLVIEQRLKRACREISYYGNYDYLIINEDLGGSIRELEAIILSVRCRTVARMERAKSILDTFGGMDAEDP
jgi:guanylate kinase